MGHINLDKNEFKYKVFIHTKNDLEIKGSPPFPGNPIPRLMWGFVLAPHTLRGVRAMVGQALLTRRQG
jgi:hypothetical protein